MSKRFSYNREQQVFVLNLCSNLVNDGVNKILGEFEAENAEDFARVLKQRIAGTLKILRPVMGAWRIAWGPCIYIDPSTIEKSKTSGGSLIADHAIYIAEKEADNSSPTRLVAAIAGSNGQSPAGGLKTMSYNWKINLDVSRLNQRSWSGGPERVSGGTMTGLENLLALKPGQGLPGSSYQIQEFLETRTSALENPGQLELTVTGFSLGGALSPALALWLSDNRNLWDPHHHVDLACRPVAGATPGNRAFAEYYNAQLKESTLSTHNQLDVVPHAWRDSDLANISTIYQPETDAPDMVIKLTATARGLAFRGKYRHLANGKSFSGGINPNSDGFSNQAIYQHVEAYVEEMGILPKRATDWAKRILAIIGGLKATCGLDQESIQGTAQVMELLRQEQSE